MAYIVRTFIYRHYKNYLCSVTGFFVAFLYLFALIFPFLFSVSTGEFWVQVKMTAEQPQIALNGNYIIQCHSGFQNETSSNIKNVTDKDYVDFQYINEDLNLDGRPDFIQFTIDFIPSFLSEQCTLVLFADVGFRNTLKLQMITPINYGVHLNGFLKFQQKETLPQMTAARIMYYNQETTYTYPYNIFDFATQVVAQNETVIPVYQTLKQAKQKSSYVSISGNLKLQTFQQAYYKPTVIQSFREVWIQYIYLAIPTFYLISKLVSFALQKKIFFAHQQVYNDQYNTI